MTDIALSAEKITKIYRLGSRGSGTLARDIENKIVRYFNKDKQIEEFANGKNGDLVTVLNDISFEVKQGETIGIIGKNGAGKSTLLKILSKITTPSSGSVSGNGRIASLLEVGTGFHPELSGKENIYLNGAILGMKKKEIQKNFDEIVAFSGIETYINTPVKSYSSGMYVRLAFAVAAHLESEILIVDEVLAVGDAEFQKKCIGKMNDISKSNGKTILFVSHNMSSIQSICGRSLLLNKGNLDLDGNTEMVISSYLKLNSMVEPLEIRKDRKGDQQIKLTAIEIGGPTNRCISGQNLNIKLIVNKINGPELSVEIAVGVSDAYGNRITIISNKREGKEIHLKNGQNEIDIQIQKLPLTIGNYFLTTFIATGSLVHDWIQDAIILKVDSDSYFPNTIGSMPAGQGNFYLDYSYNC